MVYADTSFLVSLYALDANSTRASEIMEQVELPVLLTSFGELELINAFHLRVFRKEMDRRKLKAARTLFQRDVVSGIYFLKPLNAETLEHALRISRRRTIRFGVRTLDILHVASALDLKAKTFLSFDDRQKSLAKAEGLSVLP